MTLRTKLLLVALSLLVLPWAGWQFVRQMEGLLRQGQEQALIASAEAIARGVAAQPGELPPARPTLFVQELNDAPRLDGDDRDWRGGTAHPYRFGGAALLLSLGRASEMLHLFVRVRDATPMRTDAHWPIAAERDHLRLQLSGPLGELRLRLANAQSGPLVVTTEDGDVPPVRVLGEWRETGDGYAVELRLPQGYAVRALGLVAVDAGESGDAREIGTDQGDVRPWPLLARSEALVRPLRQLLPPGMRARLVDRDGWVLAGAGALQARAAQSEVPEWRRALYRWLLFADDPLPPEGWEDSARVDAPELAAALAGQSGSAWRRDPHGAYLLLSAAVPVTVGNDLRGAVLLERENDALLLLTDRALTGLLGISLLAMLGAGAVLLVFASRLGLRIRRLRDAAERALDREGRVRPDPRQRFPITRARDEIGDLSRSFARLLEEVGAYTDYLRSLAAKLSHELNTPLAVVRTSLDNLDADALPAGTQPYLARARHGVDRLGAIVRAMAEVTRLEHAVSGAEGEEVDLCALVAACAEGYRPLLAPRRLEVALSEGPLPFHGAPELIAQALDKLVDNARGFTPEDGWLRIALESSRDGIALRVANVGPPLPVAMRGKLFDTLVSVRDKTQRADGAPHLGLGLTVVRLVAELHGGRAEARDLPGGEGVEFTLFLRGMPRRR